MVRDTVIVLVWHRHMLGATGILPVRTAERVPTPHWQDASGTQSRRTCDYGTNLMQTGIGVSMA